jgi:hypothetical protein
MALKELSSDSAPKGNPALSLRYRQVPLFSVPDAKAAPIRQMTTDDAAGLELVSPRSPLGSSNEFYHVRLVDGTEGYVYHGNVVSPSDSVTSRDDERRGSRNLLPTITLWSPMALRVVTILCGFVAGSIIWFLNRRRLGLITSPLRDGCLLFGAWVLLSAFWAVLPSAVPAVPVVLLLNLGSLWFFNSTLEKNIERYADRGGEIAYDGNRSALGIGVLGIVLGVALNTAIIQVTAPMVAR